MQHPQTDYPQTNNQRTVQTLRVAQQVRNVSAGTVPKLPPMPELIHNLILQQPQTPESRQQLAKLLELTPAIPTRERIPMDNGMLHAHYPAYYSYTAELCQSEIEKNERTFRAAIIKLDALKREDAQLATQVGYANLLMVEAKRRKHWIEKCKDLHPHGNLQSALSDWEAAKAEFLAITARYTQDMKHRAQKHDEFFDSTAFGQY